MSEPDVLALANPDPEKLDRRCFRDGVGVLEERGRHPGR